MGNSTLSMLKVFVFGKGEYFTNGFFTIFKKPSSAEHARRMKELYDSWNFQNNIQNMPTWADVRLAHLERLADIKAMEAQQAFDSSVEQVAVLASENTELFTMLGVLAIFAVLVVGFFKNIDIIFGNTP